MISNELDGEPRGNEYYSQEMRGIAVEWGKAVAAAPAGQAVSAEADGESVEIPELNELGFTFTGGTQGNEVVSSCWYWCPCWYWCRWC